MRPYRSIGFAFGLAATALWGSAYPASRILFNGEGEGVDAVFTAFLLILLSAVVFTPALFRRDQRQILRVNCRRDLPLLLVLAATGIVAESSLHLISTKYTTAARASLLANAAPVYTVLLSALVSSERLGWKKAAGAVVGLAGVCVAMVSSGGDLFTGGGSTWLGDLLAAGSGVCWAVYTVVSENLSSKYRAAFCMGLLFWFGTLMMIPVLIVSGCRIDLSMPAGSWLGIVYLGVLTRGAAFGLWYAALRYLRPGELGAFGYLTPLLAWLLSALLLGEKVGLAFLAALALILGGIALMAGGADRRSASA